MIQITPHMKMLLAVDPVYFRKGIVLEERRVQAGFKYSEPWKNKSGGHHDLKIPVEERVCNTGRSFCFTPQLKCVL